MRARRVLLPALCAAVLLAGGCSVTSSGGGGSSSAAATRSSSGSASAAASASATPGGFTTTCDDALSLTAVGTAAGQPVVGSTSFVVGAPDPSIGRVAYLNCRYGLPDPASGAPAAPTAAASGAPVVPAVEIGVSLYDTAARAAARVASTVDDYRSTGAAPTGVTVDGASGTLLVTPGQPRTLVVAQGRRTVAVSMSDAVFTGTDQIVAVAALALSKVR